MNSLLLLIDKISELESQLFPDDNWTAESIADLLQQDINQVMVLQDNDKLLGYCLYQVVFEKAEILRIGVNPSLQNKGIGTQIFNNLLEVLAQKNVENLMLEVREDNHNAIHFYQKQGFSTIHVRKNYYQLQAGESVNALIMQKILT